MSFETKVESITKRLEELHEQFHKAFWEYKYDIQNMLDGRLSMTYGASIERMVRMDLLGKEARDMFQCISDSVRIAEEVINMVVKDRGLTYEQTKKDVDECYLKLDPTNA